MQEEATPTGEVEESKPAVEPQAEKPVEAPADMPASEPTKPRRRLRRALLWIVSLLVIFAAGVILTWTLRVQPQMAQIEELQTALATAQEQIAVQEDELSELRPLVEENARLEDELEATRTHLDILDVLVDVTTAQLAMAQEDPIAAEAALEGTAETLASLGATLEGADAAAVDEISGRLVLVLEEVETDAFAARRDLEIMANDLLALERALFAE